mmetsp:Transcript_12869/g.55246  ORF Transcript_12869/g.55246 Transcript_12869/m.55246 type:complete len:258 (+) Transcript_12869:2728-3501(+)
MASPRGMGRGHARARQGRQVHRRGAPGGGGGERGRGRSRRVSRREGYILAPRQDPARPRGSSVVRSRRRIAGEPRRREGRGRRGWDPSGDDGRSGARLAGFAARAQFHVRPGGFQVRFRRRAGQATRGGQGAAGGCRAGPARGASQDGQRRERGERASVGAAGDGVSRGAAQGWHIVRSPSRRPGEEGGVRSREDEHVHRVHGQLPRDSSVPWPARVVPFVGRVDGRSQRRRERRSVVGPVGGTRVTSRRTTRSIRC